MWITRWGTGPRVVLLHGGARGGPVGGASTFAAQRPLAEAGWELVLPDRPGHGRSPAFGREDMEQEAVWAMELLGEGAHLVGHSYGGAIALCAAAARPSAVRSLTLIEAPVFSEARGNQAADALAHALADAINQPDELSTILAFVRVAGIPTGVLRPAPDPGQVMVMARSLKLMRDPVTWDAGPALGAVESAGIPALVVTGGWSPGFEAIADALAARLRARRVVIEAGHHLPHLARTEPGAEPGAAFNAALALFLRECVA
jgi:pimeloyl-ACP methyl ester carboxylesterase